MGSSIKRPLLLDGALGTELERHGVDTSGRSWTAYANRDHAKLIRDIHLDYILAGADIITANTFRTNPRAVGIDAESLTKGAIEIAKSAASDAGRTVLIAGSMAPVEDCFSPELVDPSTDNLEEEHALMAGWLRDAGVDLLLIETMNSAREAIAAVRAAKRVSKLPVYVSLVPKTGTTLLDDTPIEEAVRAVAEAGADLVALNCAPVSVMRLAKDAFVKAALVTGVPFGCYPNASEIDAHGVWQLHTSSDDDIATLAQEWLDTGTTLIGSCCGTQPRTTSRLFTLIESRVAI